MPIEKVVYYQGRCDKCGELFPHDLSYPLHSSLKELKQLMVKEGWFNSKEVICGECKSKVSTPAPAGDRRSSAILPPSNK
jgi:uncharacterized CHY-type Zn-finger protein